MSAIPASILDDSRLNCATPLLENIEILTVSEAAKQGVTE